MGKAKSFLWDHVIVVKRNDKGMHINECKHCKHVFAGGPHRIKAHLLGLKGQGVDKCRKVTGAIKDEIKKLILDVDAHESTNANENSIAESENNVDVSTSNANVVPPTCASVVDMSSSSCKKRKIENTSGSLQISWQKSLNKNADESVRRFFFVEDIPHLKVDSTFFHDMVQAIAKAGPSYKPPSSFQLGKRHLDEEVKVVEDKLSCIKEKWKIYGCTIVSDGWSDTRNRPIINVLASSMFGLVFLRSVDTSEECKTGEYIFDILKATILEIGPTNVVQVCMDNASNCVAARHMIEKEWPMIFFTRCTCHCLDLLFEDIGKCAWVNDALRLGLKVTTFITRKQYVLAMFRKFSKKELLKPSTTRFAYSFIVLSNLFNDRVYSGLRRMVVSEEWCQWKGSKTQHAEEVVSIILNASFWSNVKMIVEICSPILKVLRLADREGATMGLIYECTRRMIEEINKMQGINNMLLDEIRGLCMDRCKMLHSPLHAIGYLLHPIWWENFQVFDNVVNASWIDTIMRYANGDIKMQGNLLDEYHAYKTKEKGIFQLPPSNDPTRMKDGVKWWELFGGETPNLSKLAIRVLSQGTCASPCERNWSTFSLIHTKRRNRLSHDHIEKLVYLHTNHRLLKKVKERDSCRIEVTLDMINKEEDDDRLLVLQSQHATMVNEDFDEDDDDGQDVNFDNAPQE